MVDKYERLRVSVDDGVETRSGSVRVVLDAPVEVKAYDGGEVTDEDVEQAAIEAIQEGKASVVRME